MEISSFPPAAGLGNASNSHAAKQDASLGRRRASQRFAVLDGWRGISILLVLAAHLLPLGPKSWELNETAARMGMALFFVLSGFLITRFFLTHDSVVDFLIRRIARILPLVWLTIALAFPLLGAGASTYLPNLFFYANLPPQNLLPAAAHFWSLGVEMQFYAAIAFVIAVGGRRGLYVLPLACICITLNRVSDSAYADIVTWRRVDEILVGGVLALACAGRLGTVLPRLLSKAWLFFVLLPLLVIASHPAAGFMNYFRPYFAAAVVGVTLCSAPVWVDGLLRSKTLAYIATISFALYVFHLLLTATWLGSGDTLVRYAKRPLLLFVTFVLAHLSTFYYEHPCIKLGTRLSNRWRARRTPMIAARPDEQR